MLYIILVAVALSPSNLRIQQDTTLCADTVEAPAGPAYREAEVNVPVRLNRRVVPTYPPASKGSGKTGFVQVRYVVNPSGCVEPMSVEILAATDSAFAEAARLALRRLQFHPAQLDGRSVRQQIHQTIRLPPPDST
ncbi:MAG TPA: energy transducer TonB [Acidimicrobiia bacterium]|nr:energy transducer TonB [Acidimicrobiia bacterium]